jgi:hypothetical protein
MIASTCSRVRPVRRAIGFATDLATRPRIPLRDALPISTALSCAVIFEWLPRTRPFETSGVPRWARLCPGRAHQLGGEARGWLDGTDEPYRMGTGATDQRLSERRSEASCPRDSIIVGPWTSGFSP